MLRTLRLIRSTTVAFLAVNLLLGAAWAQKETVLYSFANSPDGAFPYFAGVVFDAKGNLYGTTYQGGDFDFSGTVFKVTPSGKETVLHNFTGGTDGAWPLAGLVFDTKGNLYGTTSNGGAANSGTVFKVTPSGKETVLYSFTGGTDGGSPAAGVVFDTTGNLYGTTWGGGSSACRPGCGVVFKLDKAGKETVLYSFTGGTDGAKPLAGLVFDTKGTLYGTASQGGSSACPDGCGVVFKLDRADKETVLYSFTGGTDGYYPDAGLIFDTRGRLYGTTRLGGGSNGCGWGCGVVFRLSRVGKYTGLHRFSKGTDGNGPEGGLILDIKGNLYGTTFWGGTSDFGTVFKVTPSGKETVLYSFTGNPNGHNPCAGLAFDAKGKLYGTTYAGGTSNSGTVFKLVP